MRTMLVWLAAAVLTVGGAIASGVYSHRWGQSSGLANAGSVIEHLPERIGAWTHVEDGESLKPFVSRELGLVNHVNRWYQHEESGRRVQLLMMVGQPGPLVRHPPTVCYANRAHEQIGPEKWIVDTESMENNRFRLLTYRPSRSEGGERFFVAYGHSAGDGWDAPDYPRVVYGAAPALYKVQVVANLSSLGQEGEVVSSLRDFVLSFIRSFHGLIEPGLVEPGQAESVASN